MASDTEKLQTNFPMVGDADKFFKEEFSLYAEAEKKGDLAKMAGNYHDLKAVYNSEIGKDERDKNPELYEKAKAVIDFFEAAEGYFRDRYGIYKMAQDQKPINEVSLFKLLEFNRITSAMIEERTNRIWYPGSR